MKKSSLSGIALTEYALIGGLIAVVGIGALTFLGGSLESLFNNNALSIQKQTSNSAEWTDQELAQLQQQESASKNPFENWFGQSGGQSQSGENNPPVLWPGGMTATEGNGNGSNTTSAEGSTKQIEAARRIKEAMAMIAQLEDKIAQMPDGPVKEWYRQAAREALMLAGSKASEEVSLGNPNKLLSEIADPALSSSDINYNITHFKEDLLTQTGNMPAEMSSAEKKQAQTLIRDIAQRIDEQASRYSFVKGTPKQYSKTPDEIKAKAFKNTPASNSTAQKTLDDGITLDKKGS